MSSDSRHSVSALITVTGENGKVLHTTERSVQDNGSGSNITLQQKGLSVCTECKKSCVEKTLAPLVVSTSEPPATTPPPFKTRSTPFIVTTDLFLGEAYRLISKPGRAENDIRLGALSSPALTVLGVAMSFPPGEFVSVNKFRYTLHDMRHACEQKSPSELRANIISDCNRAAAWHLDELVLLKFLEKESPQSAPPDVAAAALAASKPPSLADYLAELTPAASPPPNH